MEPKKEVVSQKTKTKERVCEKQDQGLVSVLTSCTVCRADVPAGTTTFGNISYLIPKDTRQLLYRLLPKVPGGNLASRSESKLGKLDLVWRTAMGSAARLQTTTLTRKAPPFTELELQLHKAPEHITCGRPFLVQVRVSNHTPQVMNLVLESTASDASTVVLDGISGAVCTTLLPQQSTVLEVPIVALADGLQAMKDLQIRDTSSDQTRALSLLPPLFVHRPVS
eukprot:m.44678 g.44678  ORF g.44678 m.44678 type:complete len:224 (+) comp17299_c0_seq2:76-747(+)